MTAEIIDFAEKKRERDARKLLETTLEFLSQEELDALCVSLRRYIINNAEATYPSSLPGYTIVMIDDVAYTISDISNHNSDT